ncbi:MAG: glycosyltransferase family 4 protein [Thermoanaerobaculia bacterium]
MFGSEQWWIMSRSLRILINCYVFPPEVQSAGTMVRELAEDLAAKGHDVTVVTGFPNFPHGSLYAGWRRSWRQETRRDGYRLVRVWHTLGLRRSVLRRIVYYATYSVGAFCAGLSLGRIDAIFDISPPLVGTPVALALAKLKRARFIFANWDIYPEVAWDTGVLKRGVVARLIARLDTMVCNRSTAVAVLAPALRSLLVARGVKPEKVIVLPLWVAVEPAAGLEEARAWRRANGLADDSFILLYAGTIGMLNDAEILVYAADLLRDRTNFALVFVGDGATRDRVARAASERTLSNVHFLPLQPRELMPAIYAAADLCAVTLAAGKGQTCAPSKMLAYMAAARPVLGVVDADSATADWIRDARCGTVVRPGDAQACAAAIERLMESSETRARYGQAARAYVTQAFERSRCTPLYESVLAGPDT